MKKIHNIFKLRYVIEFAPQWHMSLRYMRYVIELALNMLHIYSVVTFKTILIFIV